MKRSPLSIFVLAAFLANSCPVAVQANEILLPKPGTMVRLSPALNPPVLKGIKVHTDNPFRFDFVLDRGNETPAEAKRESLLAKEGQLKEESTKLIKYFLASLTTPEKDMWVNLSPYEKDRIVPEGFGQTEMGRDLLAQDYILKQITASLIYPEDEVGKKFWKRIYEEAAKRFGNTNVPVNTFNKVWIVPGKAEVYENAKTGTAYVVGSSLNVMLESDYLSAEKHAVPTNDIGKQIVREIVIPELTKEVNEGANFARLRQVYSSLILAAWYKKKIKDSILSQVYTDKNKVAGVSIDNPQEKQKIYARYLEAFKKGAYNYIKEEQDPITRQFIPRKYFSGGLSMAMSAVLNTNSAMSSNILDWAKRLSLKTIAVTMITTSAALPTLAQQTIEGNGNAVAVNQMAGVEKKIILTRYVSGISVGFMAEIIPEGKAGDEWELKFIWNGNDRAEVKIQLRPEGVNENSPDGVYRKTVRTGINIFKFKAKNRGKNGAVDAIKIVTVDGWGDRLSEEPLNPPSDVSYVRKSVDEAMIANNDASSLNAVGISIFNARTRLGKSFGEVAEAVGVNSIVVRYWEEGRSYVDTKTGMLRIVELRALALYLGLDVIAFMKSLLNALDQSVSDEQRALRLQQRMSQLEGLVELYAQKRDAQRLLVEQRELALTPILRSSLTALGHRQDETAVERRRFLNNQILQVKDNDSVLGELNKGLNVVEGTYRGLRGIQKQLPDLVRKDEDTKINLDQPTAVIFHSDPLVPEFNNWTEVVLYLASASRGKIRPDETTTVIEGWLKGKNYFTTAGQLRSDFVTWIHRIKIQHSKEFLANIQDLYDREQEEKIVELIGVATSPQEISQIDLPSEIRSRVDLGDFLRKRRHELTKNIDQIANETESSKEYVYGIENGDMLLNAEHLDVFANAYQLSNRSLSRTVIDIGNNEQKERLRESLGFSVVSDFVKEVIAQNIDAERSDSEVFDDLSKVIQSRLLLGVDIVHIKDHLRALGVNKEFVANLRLYVRQLNEFKLVNIHRLVKELGKVQTDKLLTVLIGKVMKSVNGEFDSRTIKLFEHFTKKRLAEDDIGITDNNLIKGIIDLTSITTNDIVRMIEKYGYRVDPELMLAAIRKSLKERTGASSNSVQEHLHYLNLGSLELLKAFIGKERVYAEIGSLAEMADLVADLLKTLDKRLLDAGGGAESADDFLELLANEAAHDILIGVDRQQFSDDILYQLKKVLGLEGLRGEALAREVENLRKMSRANTSQVEISFSDDRSRVVPENINQFQDLMGELNRKLSGLGLGYTVSTFQDPQDVDAVFTSDIFQGIVDSQDNDISKLLLLATTPAVYNPSLGEKRSSFERKDRKKRVPLVLYYLLVIDQELLRTFVGLYPELKGKIQKRILDPQRLVITAEDSKIHEYLTNLTIVFDAKFVADPGFLIRNQPTTKEIGTQRHNMKRANNWTPLQEVAYNALFHGHNAYAVLDIKPAHVVRFLTTDSAMNVLQIASNGGIDFNSDKMNLMLQNSGEAIRINADPALLAQLQNVPGFMPVIINIQPMTDLKVFLGL